MFVCLPAFRSLKHYGSTSAHVDEQCLSPQVMIHEGGRGGEGYTEDGVHTFANSSISIESGWSKSNRF